MKKISKILSVILAIMMVISIVPITASAATYSGTCGDNMTWELDKTTGVLTFSGSGEMWFYTSSNTPWGDYKNYIKEVVINEGITTIGEFAFYELYITNVTFPDSLIRIEDYAFKNCTKLNTVTIPDGVRQIDSYAFANCTRLTSITLPDSLRWIKKNVFASCTSLTDVYYLGSQQDWQLIDISAGNGYLFDANITYAKGSSYTWEFDKETGTLTFNGTGEIPDYYNEDEDYHIKQPWYEFENDIKHIVISEGITSIGSYAFALCDSLETVTMNSVEFIGEDAFINCVNLKTITTSNSLKVIEDGAFYKCEKLTYIYYSGTQEEWNNISIDENLNDVLDYVKVYPSDYVINSDSGTFKAVTGGNTFSWAFDADSLTLTISGEGDMGLFMSAPWEQYQFDIKKLVFTDGVTSICSTIFNVILNLTEIVIPESVIKISNQAFNSSDSITDVYYSGAEEQWNNITIGTGNDSLLNATIHYNSTGPHIHDYETVVTDPTCTEQGYTTYTCECGDSYIDDYVDALGHSHTSEITTPATHTTTGLMTYTCACGDTYTEIIEKVADHDYETVVTDPTCTEQGYTTYTCECGDSYVDDYVDALGHSHTSEITTPATHTTTGVITYTCHCGDTYTETIEKIAEHNHEAVVTPPTCTEQGYTTYTCECGDSYVDDYIDATGHNYVDNVCIGCGDTIIINGWQLEDGKWAYYVNNEKLTNKWIKDSVDWCYLGADGYCVSNTWKADSKGWCYIGEDCRIIYNQWLNDNGKWYFIDANGYMVSSKWMKDSVDWCYLGSNGAMLTNAWAKDSIGWCYVGANGYCLTNAWKADSKGWCYLDANGRMVINDWVQDCGKWYYLDGNGYMVTGTRTIGGKTYKFASNGVWIG